jgi:hypothetical protein
MTFFVEFFLQVGSYEKKMEISYVSLSHMKVRHGNNTFVCRNIWPVVAPHALKEPRIFLLTWWRNVGIVCHLNLIYRKSSSLNWSPGEKEKVNEENIFVLFCVCVLLRVMKTKRKTEGMSRDIFFLFRWPFYIRALKKIFSKSAKMNQELNY